MLFSYILRDGEKKSLRPSVFGIEINEIEFQEVYFGGIR